MSEIKSITPGNWRQAGNQVVSGDVVIAKVQTTVFDAMVLAASRDMAQVLKDVAALLPAAARMHPDDVFKLQGRVVAALAKAGL